MSSALQVAACVVLSLVVVGFVVAGVLMALKMKKDKECATTAAKRKIASAANNRGVVSPIEEMAMSRRDAPASYIPPENLAMGYDGSRVANPLMPPAFNANQQASNDDWNRFVPTSSQFEYAVMAEGGMRDPIITRDSYGKHLGIVNLTRPEIPAPMTMSDAAATIPFNDSEFRAQAISDSGMQFRK